MSAQAAALSAGAAATRMLAVIDPAAVVIVSTYPLASQVLGRLHRCGRITAGRSRSSSRRCLDDRATGTWPTGTCSVQAGVTGERVEVRAAEYAPWHPGRCAEVRVDGAVVGHAGELHPRVVAALELPRRTCALEAGVGELLEDVRLFDVYSGAQLGEGRRSLAYKLTFRAPDRTLTVEEAVAARDAAVAVAAQRLGATLRGA